jgi:hypothetical protein
MNMRHNPYEAPTQKVEAILPEPPRGIAQLAMVALCIVCATGLPMLIWFRIVGVLAPYARYGKVLELVIISLHFMLPIASITSGRYTAYFRNSRLVVFFTTIATIELVILVIFSVLAFLGQIQTTK